MNVMKDIKQCVNRYSCWFLSTNCSIAIVANYVVKYSHVYTETNMEWKV